ncbi:MAG: hypothetical protein D6725_08040 [Planctomycetota bacterium]|nr:MAG: hypothetical protein D6725_08040 [Planctomycetota bacterium]
MPALPGDAELESPELRRERELLELLRGDMPDDPFSPAVFNERFGSPAESSGTGRQADPAGPAAGDD